MNGLTALVRSDKKSQTLKYINELSSVFRYILQSDKKGLVPLSEELKFLESFRYLQEIRYADKFRFTINVPEEKKSPVPIDTLAIINTVLLVLRLKVPAGFKIAARFAFVISCT